MQNDERESGERAEINAVDEILSYMERMDIYQAPITRIELLRIRAALSRTPDLLGKLDAMSDEEIALAWLGDRPRVSPSYAREIGSRFRSLLTALLSGEDV